MEGAEGQWYGQVVVFCSRTPLIHGFLLSLSSLLCTTPVYASIILPVREYHFP